MKQSVDKRRAPCLAYFEVLEFTKLVEVVAEDNPNCAILSFSDEHRGAFPRDGDLSHPVVSEPAQVPC